MAKTIDSHVVELGFDNDQFKKGVKTSLDSLDDLRQGLDIDREANAFSASAAILTGAFMRIGSEAADMATKLAKSMTLDPIIQGFSAYEEQIGSVQVIMNATNGVLGEVENVMSRLVWFADETSYSTSHMSNALSRFVSNNIELETAATTIQGIANAAALAGVSGQKAAMAFNNFSDAIGKGGMTVNDFKSLELANVTTTTFKETAIEAAIAVGTLSKEGKILAGDMEGVAVSLGNFKQTLSEGASGMWYNNDVIVAQMEAFGRYSEEVYRVVADESTKAMAQIRSVGDAMDYITEQHGADWEALGKKAFLAAQESKSLSDSINYTKDALASGWASSWKYILGNYEEARDLFSNLSDLFYRLVVVSGETRNDILYDWRNMGFDGRNVLLLGIDKLIDNIRKVAAPIRDAFESIFDPMTGEKLYVLTAQFALLMGQFKMGEKTAENLRRTFAGVFAVFDIGWMAIKEVVGFFGRLIGMFAPVGDGLLGVTGGFGDFIVNIRDAIKEGELFRKFFDFLIANIEKFLAFISPVTGYIGKLFEGLADKVGELGAYIKNLFLGADDGGATTFTEKVMAIFEKLKGYFSGFSSSLGTLFSGFGDKIRDAAGVDAEAGFLDIVNGLIAQMPTLDMIIAGVKNFVDGFGAALSKLSPWLQEIWDIVGPLVTGLLEQIKSSLKNMDFGQFLTFLNTVMNLGIVKAVLNLTGAFGEFKVTAEKTLKTLGDLFKGLEKAAMRKATASAIKDIAISVGILVAAIVALSFIELKDIGIGLGVITIAMGELVGAFLLINKMTKDLDPKKGGSIVKLAVTIIALSTGVLILASALKKLEGMSVADMAKGFLVITLLMAELLIAAKVLSSSGSLLSTAAGMLLLSLALSALVGSMKLYSKLDPEMMALGLLKIGLAILALGNVMHAVPDNILSTAAGLLVLSFALNSLVGTIFIFSKIPWDMLLRGLATMAITLVTLGLAMRAVDTSIKTAAAFAILAASLNLLVLPLVILSKLSLGQILTGLLGIAGSLAVFAIAAKTLKKEDVDTMKDIGKAMLAFAGGFKVLSIAIKGMDTDTFVKTLIAVGAMVLMLKVLSNSKKDAKGALSAAMALVVVLGALAVMFLVMQKFADVDKMQSIGIALGAAMVGMAAMLFAMSKIDAKQVAKATVAVLLLEVLMVGIGGVLWAITKILGDVDINSLIPLSAALGIVMLSLAGTMYILGEMDGDVGAGAVLAMAGLAAVMGIVGLVLAMTAKLTSESDPVSLIPIAIALGILMPLIAAAALVLSKVPPGSLRGALDGAGIMVLVIAVMAVLVLAMTGLGLLLNELVKDEAALNRGLDMIVNIFRKLGEALGGFVSGLLVSLFDPLPSMGNSLTKFMENCQGFIDGVRGLDGAVLEGAGVLVALVTAIGASTFLACISAVLSGGFGGRKLGKMLKQFGESISEFYNSTLNITDPERFAVIGSAAVDLMKAFDKAPNTGGLFNLIAKLFVGKKDSSPIVDFGKGIAQFSEEVADVKQGVVRNTAETMVILFKALKEAPNDGGFISILAGDNGGTLVGQQLEDFGKHLKAFGGHVEGLNTGDITDAAKTMTQLFKALKEAPNEGGLAGEWAGSNSGTLVGQQLEDFGVHLKTFGGHAAGLNTEDIEAAAKTMVVLFQALKDAPNEGGVIGLLTGNNGGDTLGKQLFDLGNGLNVFGGHIARIGTKELRDMGKATASFLESITNTPSMTTWTGKEQLVQLSSQLGSLGTGFKEFATNLGGAATKNLDPAITAMKTLFVSLSEMPNLSNIVVLDSIDAIITRLPGLGESLESFSSHVSDATSTNLISAAPAITELSLALKELGKVQVNTAAWDLGNTLVDSIFGVMTSPGQTQKIQIKMEEFLKSLVTYLNSPTSIALIEEAAAELFSEDTFIPTGEAIIDSIAKGMDANDDRFIASMKEMGEAAIEGLSNGLQVFNGEAPLAYSFMKDLTRNLILAASDGLSSSRQAGYLIGDAFVEGFRDATTWHSPPDFAWMYNEDLKRAMEEAANEYEDDHYESGYTIGNAAGTGVIEGFDDALAEMNANTEKTLGNGLPQTIQEVIEAGAEKAGPVISAVSEKLGFGAVDSVGSGIKSNGSAQRAAKSKGEAIADSFAEGLSKIGNVMTLLDAQFKLFEAGLGFVDPDDEMAQTNRDLALTNKELEITQEKLVQQTEAVNLMQQRYAAILAETGEESDEARKALLDYIDAQTQALDLQTKIDELIYNRGQLQTKASGGALGSRAKMLEKEIAVYTRAGEKAEVLEEMGYAFDDLALFEATAKEMGFDTKWREKLNGEIVEAVGESVEEVSDSLAGEISETVFTEVAVGVEEGIVEGTDSGLQTVSDSGSAYKPSKKLGEEISDEVAIGVEEGIVEGAEGGMQAIGDNGTAHESSKKLGEEISDEVAIGVEEGIVEGANNGLQTVSDDGVLTKPTEDLVAEIVPELEPLETEFYTVGQTYTEGTAQGMADSVPLIEESSDLVATEAKESMEVYVDEFEEVGRQYIQGAANGIMDSLHIIADAGAKAGEVALFALKQALMVASPSKATYAVGGYTVDGFVNALYAGLTVIEDAGDAVGNAALTSIQEAITDSADYMMGNMDLQPTITPIIDLDDVRSKTKAINGMLNDTSDMNTSLSLANTAAASRRDVGTNQNGSGEIHNVYEFNQYNNSPKPLDRLEIYRQTRNQFSAMKGMVTTA